MVKILFSFYFLGRDLVFFLIFLVKKLFSWILLFFLVESVFSFIFLIFFFHKFPPIWCISCSTLVKLGWKLLWEKLKFAFKQQKTFILHIRLVLRNKFSHGRRRWLSLMSSDMHTDYRHIHAVSTDVHLIYRNFVLLLLLLGCVDHVDAAEVVEAQLPQRQLALHSWEQRVVFWNYFLVNSPYVR